MRMPAVLAALLAVGWPALCMAEPLKVFDSPWVLLVIFSPPALLLFGLPALLLAWYLGRQRRPEPRSWSELTAERCALVQKACLARGLHLRALNCGHPGLTMTVAVGTQVYELRAAAPDGLRGEALQDALVQSALGRIDALRALLDGGGSG